MWRLPVCAVTAVATYHSLAQLPVRANNKRPVTSNQLSVDVPGVYAWGSNRGHIINDSTDRIIKKPRRISYFDGKLLRDLIVTESLGVAVLENGDVVQWGPTSPQVVVKGKDIMQINVAADKCIYGLAKSGKELYSWPVVASTKGEATTSNSRSSWWQYWITSSSDEAIYSQFQLPPLSYFEYVIDLKVGKDHLLVLTNHGRVFTGSTGSKQPDQSRGQYGIASMSQFDPAPMPGKLHEVLLLKDLKSPIQQIAAGDYHSLVRTKDGRVFGFGENLYGQLGIPFSYRTTNLAVPTLIPYENSIKDILELKNKTNVALDIAARGSVSYVSIQNDSKQSYFAMGNGLTGQMGTGLFTHVQGSPALMKYLSSLTEYSEKLGKQVQICAVDWSVGSNHTAVTIGANNTKQEHQVDVLMWGGNEFSQLGTGKRNNVPTPQSTMPLTGKDDNFLTLQLNRNWKIKFDDSGSGKTRKAKVDQIIYAGENCSAVYYKPSM